MGKPMADQWGALLVGLDYYATVVYLTQVSTCGAGTTLYMHWLTLCTLR